MFCLCGCGQLTPVATRNLPDRGYIKGQPISFARGHSLNKSKEAKEAAFWARVRVLASGCWEWLGPVDEKGYGKCYDPRLPASGSAVRAHIVSYSLLKGDVPDGLELDHGCKFRRCVNPDHLEPVTHLVNMRRGANTKLTDEQVVYIKESKEKGVVLAARFGVAPTTISAIRRRPNYHVVEGREMDGSTRVEDRMGQ